MMNLNEVHDEDSDLQERRANQDLQKVKILNEKGRKLKMEKGNYWEMSQANAKARWSVNI